MMEILIQHAWLGFIAISLLNHFLLKFRVQVFIDKDPSLQPGYNQILRGALIVGNIPWMIMGAGQISGLTTNLAEYLHPNTMNIAVMIFHVTFIALWVLGAWWIYFNKGAEFLERHPGLFRKTSLSGNVEMSAKQIKIFTPIMLVGAMASEVLLWLM